MDRVTDRGRAARRHPARLLGAVLVTLVAVPLAAPFASAARAADPLTLSTPYPSVAVQPGASVSFPITVTSDALRVVDLSIDGTPQGGAARLTGGGFTVDSVQADAEKPAAVSLDVILPADASGTIPLTVRARSGGLTADLRLSMRVESGAGGSVTIDPVTGQKTAAGGTLSYSLAIHNNTPRDTTFTFSTQQPAGWQVNALPGGSSQATSLKVPAAGTGSVSVSVAPPSGAAAGDYQVEVDVAADGNIQPDPALLPVTITGSYTLSLDPTQDETLAMTAQAGAVQKYTWVISNTGSGTLTGITISATPPTGWTTTFDTPTIDRLDPGKTQNVTASVTPASNAVAGDYRLAFNVTSATSPSVPAATANETVRVTVQVGLNWLVVGGALIVLVVIALTWMFGRFGRR